MWLDCALFCENSHLPSTICMYVIILIMPPSTYIPRFLTTHSSSRLRSRIRLHWLQTRSCHWGGLHQICSGSEEMMLYHVISMKYISHIISSYLIPYIRHHWLQVPSSLAAPIEFVPSAGCPKRHHLLAPGREVGGASEVPWEAILPSLPGILGISS